MASSVQEKWRPPSCRASPNRARSPGDIIVCDVIAAAAQRLATVAGVAFAETNADLVALSDALVLCVKPIDELDALRSLQTGAAE